MGSTGIEWMSSNGFPSAMYYFSFSGLGYQLSDKDFSLLIT